MRAIGSSVSRQVPLLSRKTVVLLAALVMGGGVAPLWAQSTTATTLGVAPLSPVAAGTAVTLTATVRTGGQAASPGQVIFCEATARHCEDSAVLGVAQLTRRGEASLTLVLNIGRHSIKAVFPGTQLFGASSSQPQAVVVNGVFRTTTTISSTRLSAGTFDLTANVAGNGPMAPTGSVSFEDATNKNQVLASAVLGQATLTSSFKAATGSPLRVGNVPAYVTVTDFNEDGVPDVAVANALDHTVSVFLGTGNGAFAAAPGSPLQVGTDPIALATGDFNSDGFPDLAVANFGNNSVNVFLGDGLGGFRQAPGSPLAGILSPQAIAVGDFDNDGVPDLAIANFTRNTVTVLLGDGSGGFLTSPGSPVEVSGNPVSITVADFNGDGMADLAVVNQNRNSVSVLLGDGFGDFFDTPGSPFAVGAHPMSVVAGDFNGDGFADLAVANYTGRSVSILLNDRFGMFAPAAHSPVAVGGVPEQVIVGDFNEDGQPDLATANLEGTVSLLFGKGAGSFAAASSSPVAASSRAFSVASADFNGDGVPDLVTANPSQSTASVLLGQLTQTATAVASNVKINGTGNHLVFANYPGDSDYGASKSGMLHLGASLLFLSPYRLGFPYQIIGSKSSPQAVTLTNASKSAVAISAIDVGGTNFDSFSETDNCGSSLGAGASCTLDVTFQPRGLGLLSGLIQIYDSDSTTPLLLPVYGRGSATTATLSPTVGLSFGSVSAGGQGATQTATLSNTGSAALSITSIAATGSAATSFVVTSHCGSTLAAKASCGIDVQFAPKATGLLKAELSVVDNGVGSPQQIPLSGTGGAAKAGALLSTAKLDFGSVIIGNLSASSNVTLTNNGGATLTISRIAIVGTNPGDFSEANTCGSSLGIGKSCTFGVRFQPAAVGARTATLQISDNASGSPQQVVLSGTGQRAGPTVVFSPTSLTFPSTPLLSLSPSQTITLKNTGNGSLTISSMAFTGAGAGSYLQVNDCERMVVAGGSCTITVTFRPKSTGVVKAALTLTDNASNSPQSVPLTGTGILVKVTVSPTSLSFPVTAVGSVSGAQQVSIQNTGTVTVHITGITISGANASSFTQLSTCSSTLAAGKSCSVIVALAPTTTGTLKATLNIADDVAGSPQTVSLTGIGR